MSSNSNYPGKSTRKMARKRRRSAQWAALLGVLGLIVVILLLKNSKVAGISGLGVLLLLLLLYTLPDLTKGAVDKKLKQERRAIRGTQAEEEIGALLEALPADYYVLNDVFCPYGNIDHIVISKTGGIFLIETKSHHGTVALNGDTLLVNGQIPEKDFIAQALRNMFWLRDAVSPIVGSKPWINTVLVFTNAFVPPLRQVRGVSIVNQKYLLNVLHTPSRSNSLNAQVWQHRENIGNRLMG
jgi:hypothetical protein